eukprot:5566650-Prymnesium_polylepis.1
MLRARANHDGTAPHATAPRCGGAINAPVDGAVVGGCNLSEVVRDDRRERLAHLKHREHRIEDEGAGGCGAAAAAATAAATLRGWRRHGLWAHAGTDGAEVLVGILREGR